MAGSSHTNYTGNKVFSHLHSPEGARCSSPAQRAGWPGVSIQSPDKGEIIAIGIAPFQGLWVNRGYTWRYAPGYYIAPRWGLANKFLPLLPQIETGRNLVARVLIQLTINNPDKDMPHAK